MKKKKKPRIKKQQHIPLKKVEKLIDIMVKRAQSDKKCFEYLTHRIKQDAWFSEGSPNFGKVLIKDIQLKNERIKKLTEERNELAKHVVDRVQRRDN